MSFPLVSKSVTLNDLERRNGRHFCVITLKVLNFKANCVKLVEIRLHCPRQKYDPKNLVFGNI